MVRLADLTRGEREHLVANTKELTGFDSRPWVVGGPLNKRRVAIITTSGIRCAEDRPFADGADAADY